MNEEYLSLRGLPLLCGLIAIGLCGLWLFPDAADAAECPNEAFRTGPSAELPDCRAYELVTPPDSNGRLLESFGTFGFLAFNDMFPTELASPVEPSFVYMTVNGPLLSPAGASGTFDVFQAMRSESGWQTVRHVSPSGAQAILPAIGGFSRDHRYTFNTVYRLGAGHPFGSLGADGAADYLNSPDGSFELTGIGSLGSERLAQGRYISEGGEHVIFVTGQQAGQSVWCGSSGEPCEVLKLQPDAPPTGTGVVYDRSAGGETRVVSLLPGDVTPAAGEQAFYRGASKDASAVAFTIEGTLYVRIDNAETLEVASGEPTYAGLSDDGRYIFYVAGGNIHRFDTEEEINDEVNSTGDGEIVNVSADGSHVYFISESQIGGKGEAGKPNLFVWSGGSLEFVATVDPEDVTGVPALTNWTSWAVSPGPLGGPGADSSRATPDGSVLAFESRAQLTAYDNDGHTEIYRYDDTSKKLVCASCNLLAEPASADARFQELELIRPAMVIHNLSDDGSRIFFETPEALVARDSDGINDIYQWHAEQSGATVDLISSGKSIFYPRLNELPDLLPRPNILFSVTPDGQNVFFAAQEPLVPGAGEGGTQAIYNARVNGGFAQPVPPPICLEEGCKGPPGTPPSLPGPPSSEGTRGAGNVKPAKPGHRCRKAKGKKRRHCKKKKAHHRAKASAGATAGESSSGGATSATSAPAFSSTAGGVATAAGPAQNAAAVSTAAAEEFEPPTIQSFIAELSTYAAGMHPDFTNRFSLNRYIDKEGNPQTDTRVENIAVSLPPGLLADVNAIPKCNTGDFTAWGNCPIDAQVGITKILSPVFGKTEVVEPVYSLEPPHPDEELARFGISVAGLPVFIDVHVRTASDYGAVATIHDAPGQAALLKATTILWGNPADPVHDPQRLTPKEASQCSATGTACEAPGGKRASGLPPTVFFSNPSACRPMRFGLTVTSYQLPGQVFSREAESEPITDCEGLPFDPSFQAEATDPATGAPSGLKTTLTIPQQSTEAVEEPSTATMEEARVTLPQGFQINAGAADGIGACDEAQVGYHQEVDQACPDPSKIGAAQIASPLLPHPIGAEVFLRNQRPGHPYGLWLASDELGLHVKIPGELEPDKATGKLTAVFTDLPQTPVSEIELNVWGGARAPLTTPEDCGAYNATWSFKPHSDDPAVTGTSPIVINQGCGARGFSPKLHAGTTDPVAGAYSPVEFDLAREDSEQNLASLDLTLPDGLLAKLKGVPLCPEEQTASGNCPAASAIGRLTALAGAGPAPLWIPQPGKAPTAVYLSGPYKGAPFSILAVVPAQAGPFDLGNVVVRSALQVDPESARATVASDPLPQVFEGVGVVYRRVHVLVDRPEFMINPTDCSELQITSHLVSVKGAVAEPSARFQVDGCGALRYTPKLKLAFKGGTKRSDHPAVRAVLTQPPHQANTAAATVLLPASEFIDQDHINSPCTRVQFREGACPKLSVLGQATAVTPLLDQPLSGPVYFRSNGGERELPDIVADLRGQIHVVLVGFVDAVPVKGTERSRIRTRFASAPDAPVTKFTINLLGGAKRGLLENSRDLCLTDRRAKVTLTAQNGRRIARNQLIKTGCPRKGR
jgi:hypothetical protein